MPRTPKWDDHILIVFSVLAGLSLSETFRSFSSAPSLFPALILSLAAFYIILDNWYFLHKDLSVIEIGSGVEVIFYLVSLITYACLPYLYFINIDIAQHSKLHGWFTTAAEWMLLNLILLCFFDAIRKVITYGHL